MSAMACSAALRPASFRSVAMRPLGQRVSAPLRAYNLRVAASAEERSLAEKLALPAASVLAAAMLFGATADPAEAARSGGRVGGSSGFSQRRAAPAPQAAAPRVQNNVIVAPPVMGGWGFGMPFFGGGFGFGYPMFGFGFGLSSFFSIIVVLFTLNFLVSVVSGFTNQKKKDSLDDEPW